MTQQNRTGLYIHIPFCHGKCPYCDFYSFSASTDAKKRYVSALCDELSSRRRLAEYVNTPLYADSVYFGGGTPSELAPEQFAELLACVRKNVVLTEDAEITVECNESSPLKELIPVLAANGVNRVSIGLQSAVDGERKKLGRRGGADGVRNAVELCKKNGITNISLDVMLGIPNQTQDSLRKTLEFCAEAEVKHISAYILKLEDGTFFYKHAHELNLPDEDETCELYLECCSELDKLGIKQYEISNFAIPGYESRHNTKYWKLEDYVGIGAAAHSFYGGKRFFFPSDAESFVSGAHPVFDCDGATAQEYIMLALRLVRGLSLTQFACKYGENAANSLTEKALPFTEKHLAICDNNSLRLTREGFLLSNTIIADLI